MWPQNAALDLELYNTNPELWVPGLTNTYMQAHIVHKFHDQKKKRIDSKFNKRNTFTSLLPEFPAHFPSL